jgi:hypothetical protein
MSEEAISRLGFVLSAAMYVGLALQCETALAQRAQVPGNPPVSTPEQNRRGIVDELRGDIDNQSKLKDIDKEIEKAWKLVEEARERAQNIRLMYARIKDMYQNTDCAVGAKLLDTIRRSRDGLAKLRTNLESQCRGIDAAAQKQLAEACDSEAKTINAEYQASQRQEEDIFSSCPSLKSTNVDQKR